MFQAAQEESLVRERETEFGPDIELCYSAELLHAQDNYITHRRVGVAPWVVMVVSVLTVI